MGLENVLHLDARGADPRESRYNDNKHHPQGDNY